jgi:Na+/H+-dicarboxylate symporter
VLLGLAGGLALGLAARAWPALAPLIEISDVVGTLFINGIRMVVMPLVVGLVISGIGSTAGAKVLAGVRWRALTVAALPALGALFALAAGSWLFAVLPIDADAARDLRASMPATSTAAIPTLRSWVIDLVPPNIIKAAADGALLPLVVFAIPMGLATSRLADDRRRAITTFFGALADAMLMIVRWLVALAPLGVLALTAPLAARLGVGVAGLLVNYIVVSVALTLAVIVLIVYPLAASVGRVPVGRLVRACVPAQSIAIASRSSVATVPAMMEAVRTLEVPEPVIAVAVPLAVSLVRVGAAVGQMTAVLFAARVFDISLTPAHMVSIFAATLITSMASPGVPGGSIIVLAPLLATSGIPAEAIGILLGADAIPDMARTLANVTGGIAATVIVSPTQEQI